MVRGHRKALTGGAVFAMALWKIPFLFMMTLSSLGAEGILTYMAFKRGLRLAGAAFAIGVMGLLAMGALASADQTIAIQWIEESINTVGNCGFMLGSMWLYRDFESRGCEF
jgi:hypothetical protein